MYTCPERGGYLVGSRLNGLGGEVVVLAQSESSRKVGGRVGVPRAQPNADWCMRMTSGQQLNLQITRTTWVPPTQIYNVPNTTQKVLLSDMYNVTYLFRQNLFSLSAILLDLFDWIPFRLLWVNSFQNCVSEILLDLVPELITKQLT